MSPPRRSSVGCPLPSVRGLKTWLRPSLAPASRSLRRVVIAPCLRAGARSPSLLPPCGSVAAGFACPCVRVPPRAPRGLPRAAVRFGRCGGSFARCGLLVVFFVSFVFSVSPCGVCSVVSARSGRRLSGAALSACLGALRRSVRVSVRVGSRVFRGRGFRRGSVVPFVRSLSVPAPSPFLPAVSAPFVPLLGFGSGVLPGSVAWRVCVASARRRSSGGASSAVSAAVLAPVRLRSSVSPSLWARVVVGLRLVRGLRPGSLPFCGRPLSGGFAPVVSGGRRSLCSVALSAGASRAWRRAFAASLPSFVAPRPFFFAWLRFGSCRVFRGGLRSPLCPRFAWRVLRVSVRAVPPVPASSPLPAWLAGSALAGALPPLRPLPPASCGGSLLSLSLPSFLSAVAAGRCPLRLSLASFSWPVRSCVLWSLAAVLGSGRVAFVVGGGAFRAPALAFLVAGLRSLGFRSFAPSLVGSRAWRAAALRFLVFRCGCSVPPAVSSLSGCVSAAGLLAVFPALSAGLSRLSVRSRGVSCPPALRPALSVCLFRLFLALFPPFGC